MIDWLIGDSEDMIHEAIVEYKFTNPWMPDPSDEELFNFIMDYDGTIPDLCYWSGRLHQWREAEDSIQYDRISDLPDHELEYIASKAKEWYSSLYLNNGQVVYISFWKTVCVNYDYNYNRSTIS